MAEKDQARLVSRMMCTLLQASLAKNARPESPLPLLALKVEFSCWRVKPSPLGEVIHPALAFSDVTQGRRGPLSLPQVPWPRSSARGKGRLYRSALPLCLGGSNCPWERMCQDFYPKSLTEQWRSWWRMLKKENGDP